MQDWLWMSAAALGRGIGAGKIDPVELAGTYLDAIDAHPMRDRIYARVTRERALAEAGAAKARAKSGQRLSPLDGVPVSWKDLFDTAGIGTEAGSKLLAGRVPEQDALVLRNATAAGLVCLGKTHMSELAFSGLGYNPSTETSPCVNDEEAVAGGSSSGAAASVAFGLAAAAVGTDTGGSVRIPAAWNDLVGLKTTSGRLSLEGVVPLILSLDTVGPLCRTVEDAALMLAALEGGKVADIEGASLEGRRFAVLETIAFDEIAEEPRAAFDGAIERLEAEGATIERIVFDELGKAMDLSACVYSSEAYGLWRDVIEANPGAMFAQILERFRIGNAHSGPDFVAAWSTVKSIRVAYDRATAGFDAVLLPTSPILPPSLKRLETEDDYYVTANLMALRNARMGNLMGICALTVPTGTPSCGLTLMAAPDMEPALLRLGAAVEAALA
ncbi:amidase family protein [Sulfitobacter sp. LCG007]